MTAPPQIKRYGDNWDLAWHEMGLAFAFSNVRQKGEDPTCMVRVVSERPAQKGHILGPQRLNLLSVTGQQNLARMLAGRIPELKETALSLITTSCAIVVEQYLRPSPTVYLDDDVEYGQVEYQAPMLPLGETTLAYGDSESAKSLICQRIGLSVQLGIPLPWGKSTPTQGNVLICDWETNQRVVTERVRRLSAGLPSPVHAPRIAYRGMLWRADVPPLRLLEDELPSLREQIARDRISLVIIDSIGFAVHGKLVDDDVARQAITDLRSLGFVTRLVVAHISKESARAERGRVDPFGSAFFRAGVRSAFEIRRAEEDMRPDHISVGVYHWKANDSVHTPPFGLGISFDGIDGPIGIAAEDLMQVPDLAARTSVSTRLYQLLKGGAKSTTELAAEAGVSEDEARTNLNRMPSVMKVIVGGGRNNPTVWGLRE